MVFFGKSASLCSAEAETRQAAKSGTAPLVTVPYEVDGPTHRMWSTPLTTS